MSAHLSMRSGNPALGSETFRLPRAAISDDVMTIGGTVNKTALATAILLMTATYTWNLGPTRRPAMRHWKASRSAVSRSASRVAIRGS